MLPVSTINSDAQTVPIALDVEAGVKIESPVVSVDFGVQTSAMKTGVVRSWLQCQSNLVDLTPEQPDNLATTCTEAPSHRSISKSAVPAGTVANVPRRRMQVAFAAASVAADPIDWILYIPSDGRYEIFDALPLETQAALTSKYETMYCVQPSVPARPDREIWRHNEYITFMKLLEREKRAASRICVNQQLFNAGRSRACENKVACDRCRKKGAVCARVVEVTEGVYKLCIYPYKASVEEGAWQTVEFWMSS
jgi:hypothetical protein